MTSRTKVARKNNFTDHLLKPNEEPLEASLASSLVWSVLLLNLSVALAFILVYLLNPTNTILFIGSYLLMCMATLAVSVSTFKSKLGFGNGIILSLISWLLMGWIYFVVQEYTTFYHWKYNVVKNISVKDASQYPNASAFYFNDGKILLEKESSSYYITGDGETSSGSVTFYLIPFVPDNWKEGDSVHVFLYGEENNQYEYMVSIEYSDFYEDLKQPYLAGLVLRVPSGTEMYTEKIDHAVKEQQLIVAKEPFILKWVKDPEQYIKDYFINCFTVILYFNFTWILFVLIRRFYFAYKRSRPNYKPAHHTEN